MCIINHANIQASELKWLTKSTDLFCELGLGFDSGFEGLHIGRIDWVQMLSTKVIAT